MLPQSQAGIATICYAVVVWKTMFYLSISQHQCTRLCKWHCRWCGPPQQNQYSPPCVAALLLVFSWFLKLTFAKWFVVPHDLHALPEAGQCSLPCLCALSQYLHVARLSVDILGGWSFCFVVFGEPASLAVLLCRCGINTLMNGLSCSVVFICMSVSSAARHV